jgi:hypothetical protein
VCFCCIVHNVFHFLSSIVDVHCIVICFVVVGAHLLVHVMLL